MNCYIYFVFGGPPRRPLNVTGASSIKIIIIIIIIIIMIIIKSVYEMPRCIIALRDSSVYRAGSNFCDFCFVCFCLFFHDPKKKIPAKIFSACLVDSTVEIIYNRLVPFYLKRLFRSERKRNLKQNIQK